MRKIVQYQVVIFFMVSFFFFYLLNFFMVSELIKTLTSSIKNKKIKNKKKATPSLLKYHSHLNLANFVSLKLTSTNYLLWEIH